VRRNVARCRLFSLREEHHRDQGGVTSAWSRSSPILSSILTLLAHALGWHAVVSIATLLMTLFIRRSDHRDTQTIHAKLDELLRVNSDAESRFTRLDEKEPEQVEAFRSRTGGTS
jgi:hypothetical protein